MVICLELTSHGPHVWYCAHLFWSFGYAMDFLRIKEVRRGVLPGSPGDKDLGGPPNLMHGFNSYTFQVIANHGHHI